MRIASNLTASSPVTITTKISQGAYIDVAQLQTDIEALCAARRSVLEAVADDAHQASDPLANSARTIDALEAIRQTDAFESLVSQLAARASIDNRRHSSNDQVDHIKQEGSAPQLDRVAPAKTILSVFGNASIPRQLFSSLQRRTDGDHHQADMPLEQLGLPSIMSASRILPCRPEVAVNPASSDLSVGKVFPARSSLPPLLPPKPLKPQQQRNSTLTFTHSGLVAVKPGRQTGYTGQPLKSGRWLGYGHNDGDPCRSHLKGKQRQRSVGTSPLERERTALGELAAQEHLLLQAACSSFAPAFDDTHAMVGHCDLETVWWKRYGGRRFSDTFGFPHELDHTQEQVRPRPDEQEAQCFAAAIAELDETMTDVVHDLSDPQMPSDLSTEQLLSSVTGLTETLASYQERRSSQFASAAREPSTEEVEIHRQLRARLAELISRTPPYLLTKHDGEQSESLLATSRLRIRGAQYSGLLEEDQLVRAAKSAAAALAAAAPSTKAQPPSATYSRNPSLAQSAMRAARTNQAIRAGSSSTQNTPVHPVRTPAMPGTVPATAPVNRIVPPQQAAGANGLNVSRPIGYSQTNGHASTSVGSPVVGHALPRAAGLTKMSAPSPSHLGPPPQKPMTPIINAPPVAPVSGHRGPTPTNGMVAGSAPPAAAASRVGPTGFHTSMTAEQQQQIMDRQRAQMAAQPSPVIHKAAPTPSPVANVPTTQMSQDQQQQTTVVPVNGTT